MPTNRFLQRRIHGLLRASAPSVRFMGRNTATASGSRMFSLRREKEQKPPQGAPLRMTGSRANCRAAGKNEGKTRLHAARRSSQSRAET